MSAPGNQKPTSLSQISGAWWELLFSGPLFRVTMSDIPVEKHMTFRETCLRTAIRHGRRASVRFRENLAYCYVQGAAAGTYMPSVRVPYTEAIPMIPPMIGPETAPKEKEFDFGACIKRLKSAQVGPPVPAAALLAHDGLRQYVVECTCTTENFRTHNPMCPSYTWLPLLEITLNKLKETPEDWYLQRQGLAPATPPPPAVTPFIPPATGSNSVTVENDPWSFPVQKPPTVAWDTKSPLTPTMEDWEAVAERFTAGEGRLNP